MTCWELPLSVEQRNFVKIMGFASRARYCEISFTPGFSPVSNDDKKGETVLTVITYLTHRGHDSFLQSTPPLQWLGHSDARQVFDLPLSAHLV